MCSSREQAQVPVNFGHRNHGFTLVELLVVIGIIAVLIGILLPSLSRAREQANSVACLANLKQMGAAMNQYLTENKGMMPFIERDNSWKPWSASNFGIGNPFGTAEQQAGQRNNFHRHLIKYLGGKFTSGNSLITLESKIFRCPSAVDLPTNGNGPRTHSNTNYTVNGVMINRKITKVRRSAEIVMVGESRYSWNVSACRPYPIGNVTGTTNMNNVEYRQWVWYETGASTAGDNAILNATLHQRRTAGNFMYADGHAEARAYKDLRPNDFGLTTGSGVNSPVGSENDTYQDIITGSTRAYATNLN